MSDTITRRDFIKGMVATGAAIYGLQLSPIKGAFAQSVDSKLIAVAEAVTKSPDPELIKRTTRQAVQAIGGMGRFVSKGSKVIIKPNIAWDRRPEQAADTNPYVVEAIVEMCLEAGAKSVRVLDYTINPANLTYERSGIKSAVERAKGKMEFVDERKFKEKSIPQGVLIKSWPIYQDIFETDVFINVPIAKHHSLTRLTLGLKNNMGLIKNREDIHKRIDQNLADLATVIKPNLTIMDAYRVLTNHGPNGGTPKDIKLVGQVIAGTDPVAVDSYAATIFGLKGEDIGYIKAANAMGLGEIDLKKVKIKKVSVS